MTAPYLIAEIAQAHDGSLGILHSYIDAVAETGVHAIKFQTHIAAAESSEYEPFRVKFSRADATRFDYWKRMELSEAQWREVAEHCKAVGIDFISSPFSVAAVHVLEAAGVQRYKVGSGEISNLLLLNAMAQTGKPIIISSGMSSWNELDTAVDFLRQRGATPAVLQCTTAYPTQPAEWALTQIAAMKQRYKTTVGYSDHSGTPVACLAAAALGAEILEFHAVFDKRMFGPDAKASLTIDEIKRLAEGVKMIAAGMQTSTLKDDASRFDELKMMFGKSLAVNKDLPAGHELQLVDLESKKPAGKGLPAAHYANVIGRRLRHGLQQWSFLNETDLDNN